MFERFTQSALRAVFWARGEASRLGSEAIEPEHLLAGFLIEDQGESQQRIADVRESQPVSSIPILARDGPSYFSAELAATLRLALAGAAPHREPTPDVVDMPVSEPCQRALIAARQHAGNSKTLLLHILWALIDDHENSVGNLLRSHGVSAEQVENAIRAT